MIIVSVQSHSQSSDHAGSLEDSLQKKEGEGGFRITETQPLISSSSPVQIFFFRFRRPEHATLTSQALRGLPNFFQNRDYISSLQQRCWILIGSMFPQHSWSFWRLVRSLWHQITSPRDTATRTPNPHKHSIISARPSPHLSQSREKEKRGEQQSKP
jgi:hypothetical protein